MNAERVMKDEFIRGYTNVLVSAWSDSAYAARLAGDPAAAVSEAGLDVPEGASVELIREPAREEGRSSAENLEEQFALWQASERTGVAVLHVPLTPVVDSGSLSLDELESVSGGGAVMCCCCPCSCSL